MVYNSGSFKAEYTKQEKRCTVCFRCIDSIKQSAYAELATDLEINKAVQYLKQGDITAASEVLKSFETKESKVASIAANNLTFLNILKEDLKEAEIYADKSLNFDRYNPYALVNKGDVYFATGDYEKARSFYREALANEASCVEALYNLGLANKKLSKFDEALDCFLKLHQILRNNFQVLYQIGNMYTQAHSMVHSDPSILAKLGEIYDKEGDKSQAFQCYYDSYRLYPSNIDVIEWLGAYYIDAQFSEKAVNYFEKAALIE
uniref:Tetratricopeptide repeat protein n=1 Tax=Romanomermis culicivorax TaxID=13658 RepID=A0A915HFK5_ROMCU